MSLRIRSSGVNFFASFQHRAEFLDVAGASFGFLGCLNPKQYCVTIGTVQILEESIRPGICV